uniref:RRM domain-containing protein n=1 Tax=Macrostomum lignano TaxID=282301 RepID=A0A1I8I0E1_9PLAT
CEAISIEAEAETEGAVAGAETEVVAAAADSVPARDTAAVVAALATAAVPGNRGGRGSPGNRGGRGSPGNRGGRGSPGNRGGGGGRYFQKDQSRSPATPGDKKPFAQIQPFKGVKAGDRKQQVARRGGGFNGNRGSASAFKRGGGFQGGNRPQQKPSSGGDDDDDEEDEDEDEEGMEGEDDSELEFSSGDDEEGGDEDDDEEDEDDDDLSPELMGKLKQLQKQQKQTAPASAAKSPAGKSRGQKRPAEEASTQAANKQKKQPATSVVAESDPGPPDVVEEIKRLMTESLNCTVFITPIPKGCTQAMLKELSKEIVSSRIPCNPKNKSENRSYAFLQYKDSTTAAKWVNMLNGKMFNGSELVAKMAQTGSVDVATLNTRQLFITNVAKDATKEEVAALFPNATSVKVPTLRDKSTAGFAFAEYAQPADALKALKSAQGAAVRGCKLRVAFGRSASYKNQLAAERKQRKLAADANGDVAGVKQKPEQQPSLPKKPSNQPAAPAAPKQQSQPATTNNKKKNKNKNKKAKLQQKKQALKA